MDIKQMHKVIRAEQTIPPISSVELSVSKEQLILLLALVGGVCGSPYDTTRVYTDKLYDDIVKILHDLDINAVNVHAQLSGLNVYTTRTIFVGNATKNAYDSFVDNLFKNK